MASRITIADVAKAAGVSAMTVSRVLNNKGELSAATREQVLGVIERLGYRPSGIARSLATNQTRTLGLMLPDIANPFFPEIVRGAEDAARERGYTIFVCNTVEEPQREASVLRLLEDKRVDGVILCSARLPEAQLLPLLAQHPAAVVVNRALPPDVAGVVRVDDAAGTSDAVAHLLRRGRRTIGLIAGPPASFSGQERIRGYKEALAAAGKTGDPALVVPCEPTLTSGAAAVTRLLAARPDLDALICYNDLVAVGALKACAALGHAVPDDVAVVGADDILLAGLVSPALTTLRVAKDAIGAAAVRLLFGRLAGEFEDPIVFRPELIVRSST